MNSDGTTPPLDYAMDPNIVNDPAYKDKVALCLTSIPTLSIGVKPSDIFGSGGFYENEDKEKPISFEYIDPSQLRTISESMRPSHRTGRSEPEGQLQHKNAQVERFHFQNAPFGGDSATDEFTDLILRAGNNRSWATTSSASQNHLHGR